MRKPNANDAEVLIRLDEIARYDESVRTALDWVREHAPRAATRESSDTLPDPAELAKYGTRVATFFELVGTLAKHGLIHEDVLFDRWLIYPFWAGLRRYVEQQREALTPLLAENFEWVANRNEKWAKAREAKLTSHRA